MYFDRCYEELYEADSEDNPYIMESEDGSVVRRGWREAGVTPAMVVRFAQTHSLAAHVMWGDALKVASYTPADAKSSLCLYVWGDHTFFVDDKQTKGVIARAKTSKPKMRPAVVLKVMARNADPPAS